MASIQDIKKPMKENGIPTLLAYFRELGSMALLGLVLYGAYDLAKNQGRDLIEVLEALRATIENQSNIQKEVLKSIQERRLERKYERSNWSSDLQPPSNRDRTE